MGDHCYVVAENLAKLSPAVVWKSELLSDEFDYLARDFQGSYWRWYLILS